MWQAEVGSGTDRATTIRDLLTKLVAFSTSKGVDTVAINAAGTGYVVGDVLTLTHAGAYLDARFEVTTIGGGGAITGLRILSNGAFANRAASATVSAGGTGYAVGNIIEVQGGSAREKAKFSVATLSGSAVATVTLFETGGAYSSTPSNPASTTKIGPTAGTGSGCTLTITYTGSIGSTGLSVTGGTGTGATVDITLVETGWTAERNTNNTTVNALTDEKQVVLKGDATGRTNKPYIGFATGTSTSGLNTRHFIALVGMIAHNPALALSAQPNFKGDLSTFGANNPYILGDENAAQQMNFWFTVDDFRIGIVHNINSGAAATDDGQYLHAYAGFLDTFATENENAYPMLIGASARQQDLDPSANSQSISGAGECIAPSSSSSGWWYYRVEDSTWNSIFNSQNLVANTEHINIMFPAGRLATPDQAVAGTQPFYVAAVGPITFAGGIGSTGRASATLRLLPVPGSTPSWLPIPLTVLSRPGDSIISQTLDLPRGQLRGFFFVYNTDSAGATITNFSEDYLTIGSDRYRIFHNHVQNAIYQFIAVKEDI